MIKSGISENDESLRFVLIELAKISSLGPLPSISEGKFGIGDTLMKALGFDNISNSSHNYLGYKITTNRNIKKSNGRVNLFAKVPDWETSTLKSSTQIVNRFGYSLGSEPQRLFCTVNAKTPNSQGLKLSTTLEFGYLCEIAVIGDIFTHVVKWKESKLVARLIETHPKTLWIKANVLYINGIEHFHFREVVFTGLPNGEMFFELIRLGTITLDHLIYFKGNRAIEKGPLFKIDTANLNLLFPLVSKFDLMRINF